MNHLERAELAALRERAYGSGAHALNAADGRRLQELEERTRVLARGSAAATSRAGTESGHPGTASSDGAGRPPSDTADSTATGAAPTDADTSGIASGTDPRTGFSGTARLLLVIAAALIPVAAITGFLTASAFAEPPADPTPNALVMAEDVDLALRERQRTEVLAFQDWDGGDVTFWGAVDDVSLWWGTADGTTCVVVAVDGGGSVPICADTAAAKAQGIREELEFFHVESDAPEAEGLVDVTDVPSTRVVVAGNPYTGQFILLRED